MPSNLRSKLIAVARGLWHHSAQLEDTATNPRMRPLRLALNAEEVADQIVRWTNHRDHWSVECREQTADGIQLHLVRTTRLLKFSDDIHVRIIASATETRVDAESQSRVGKGDLGQNARNLLELVEGLTTDQRLTKRD